MYYRHRNMFADSLSADFIIIGLFVTLLLAFVAVKLILFLFRTLKKYSDHRSLWISLAVCIVLSLVGLLLGVQVDPSFSILPVIGIAGFLITCCVVSLRNRDTLMREQVSLIDSVLRQSWWSSEDTPCVETEEEPTPIAA